jgi:hypothetical protein
MTTTLYNLRTDGDQYRITKFTDGNPESSYLISHFECQCPAGERATCRHRAMLPVMLNHEMANTPYFWDFDISRMCDFEGNTLEMMPVAEGPPAEALPTSIPPPAATAMHAEPAPHGVVVSTRDFAHNELIDQAVAAGPIKITTPLPLIRWRRL